MASKQVFRIPPNHYIHVTDQNTNVTRLVCGPLTYVCQDHETVIAQKQQNRNTVKVSYGSEQKQNDAQIRPMVIVPSFHYCVVKNPHRRAKSDKGSELKQDETSAIVSEEGFEPVLDSSGQVQLFHGKKEVRLHQGPFPLYPGEEIDLAPTKLIFVEKHKALRLRCMQDFDNRKAGEEWLFEGPGYCIPNVFVKICIWAPASGGMRGGHEWRPLNNFEKQQAPTKYIISAHLIREHEVLKLCCCIVYFFTFFFFFSFFHAKSQHNLFFFFGGLFSCFNSILIFLFCLFCCLFQLLLTIMFTEFVQLKI